MSGGKGGSQTTSVEIPEYIEKAAQRNLNKAEGISQLGYVPYYGPDVAAFSPMQQAAMQNVGSAASAFGMATPMGQDIYGMPAPTTYAGGIQGYSSAPLYQQSVDELARQRPAQKSYIDSFFIDPYTGQYGANTAPLIDYTQITTMAEDARTQADANRANELAIEQARAGAGPQALSYYNYNNQDFSTTSPATTYITNPASGITDTSTPNPIVGLGNDIQEQIIGNTIGLFDPTYKVGEINNPIETPTVQEMIDATPSGAEYNPATGAYVQDDTTIDVSPRPVARPENLNTTAGGPLVPMPQLPALGSGSSKIGTDAGDGMVWAQSENSNALVRVPAPTETTTPSSGGGSDSGGSSDGGGGGCVVATHAVNSGAFTPSMKREAVVWCMNVLHDKWWGEAIRRGYRHLGRKKIEQGKAHEHYQEFRDYIAFASGKKRTIKGAIHFAARTVQFFAVGLIKGDA